MSIVSHFAKSSLAKNFEETGADLERDGKIGE